MGIHLKQYEDKVSQFGERLVETQSQFVVYKSMLNVLPHKIKILPSDRNVVWISLV